MIQERGEADMDEFHASRRTTMHGLAGALEQVAGARNLLVRIVKENGRGGGHSINNDTKSKCNEKD